MNVVFLDERGESRVMEMGCYGIGVSRVVAAAIEQNFDQRGIIFPAAMAPFQVALLPIGLRKSAEVRAAAEAIYAALTTAGIDTLFDDRDERPGVMFADQELMGIPHRFVLGERSLKLGEIDYQGRRDAVPVKVSLQSAVEHLKSRLWPN